MTAMLDKWFPVSGQDRKEFFWLMLIALVVIGAGIGLRDPWPADEPRFVLVAQQMVHGGDWWFPHRGQELYPDKPPLFMWLLAGAYLIVGSVRWSFLLPSLCAAMLTLWLTWDLGRRLWSPRAGLWGAIAVLAAPAFVYQVKRAQIDPVLVGLTTIAFYGLLRHLLLGPSWRWFRIGCFAAGLGVVAKGVGFLPLLALLPFALMRWRDWNGLASLGTGNGWRWCSGVAMFFLAIALWLLPMVTMALTDGDASHRAYLDNILLKQTVTRYADPWHHYEPVWYFAEVILLFWAPFSLAFFWLWRPWTEAWRNRDARVLLPLAWAILVIAFFSGSSGKRDMYILPALPAFALAAAPFLQRLSESSGFRKTLLTYVVLLGGLLLAAGVWALSGEPRFESKLLAERGLGKEAQWLWGMLTVIGGAGLLAAAIGRLRGVFFATALLLGSIWVGWGIVVHPLLDEENSARGVMQAAREKAGQGVSIGLVTWKEQNLLQAVGPVTEFGFRRPRLDRWQDALTWLREDPVGRRLFADDPAIPFCVPAQARISLGASNRRQWKLLDGAAIAGCPLRLTEADVPEEVFD